MKVIWKTLLENNNIKFIYQYKTTWLGRQSLDFYLPEYQIGIECQGEQHFKPVEWFGGKNGFIKTIERDKRKQELCLKNGIKTIYYCDLKKYDKFNNFILFNKNNILQEIIKYDKRK